MTDHLKSLETARDEMVKARRSAAEALAKYSAQTTPASRKTFIEIQTAIDQIDKAIADEKHISTNSKPRLKREGQGYE